MFVISQYCSYTVPEKAMGNPPAYQRALISSLLISAVRRAQSASDDNAIACQWGKMGL